MKKNKTSHIKQLAKKAKKAKKYHLEVVAQMLTLATNAFGLVAALAWNNVINTFVNDYIRPFVGNVSGLISLFIYAVVVTVLAVTITLQLSKIKKTLEDKS